MANDSKYVRLYPERAVAPIRAATRVLEKRESMKEAKAEYNRLDRAAKARIDEKKYGSDGDVRIGRFVVGQRRMQPRHADFDVAGGVRIIIKKMDD